MQPGVECQAHGQSQQDGVPDSGLAHQSCQEKRCPGDPEERRQVEVACPLRYQAGCKAKGDTSHQGGPRVAGEVAHQLVHRHAGEDDSRQEHQVVGYKRGQYPTQRDPQQGKKRAERKREQIEADWVDEVGCLVGIQSVPQGMANPPISPIDVKDVTIWSRDMGAELPGQRPGHQHGKYEVDGQGDPRGRPDLCCFSFFRHPYIILNFKRLSIRWV